MHRSQSLCSRWYEIWRLGLAEDLHTRSSDVLAAEEWSTIHREGQPWEASRRAWPDGEGVPRKGGVVIPSIITNLIKGSHFRSSLLCVIFPPDQRVGLGRRRWEENTTSSAHFICFLGPLINHQLPCTDIAMGGSGCREPWVGYGTEVWKWKITKHTIGSDLDVKENHSPMGREIFTDHSCWSLLEK